MDSLVYNGVEKSFADWGLMPDVEVYLVSKGKSSVTATSVEDTDSAPSQFVQFSAVSLKRDGTIWFQGFVGEVGRMAEGGIEHIRYTFYDVWWFMERQRFKQVRKQFSGYTAPNDPTTAPTFKNIFMSEIFLGEKSDGTYQTNGQQIVEIVGWMNEVFNPTRRGAISGQDATQDIIQIGAMECQVNIPKVRVNDIFCSEGIINLLRWSPDCACYFDYTTSPVTLQVKKNVNLPNVSADLTVQQEGDLSLQPNGERQLPGVMIQYRRVDQIEGVPWPNTYVDKYPPTTDDYTPFAAHFAIELTGAVVQHVQAQVEVTSVAPAVSGIAADRKGWWLDRDKTLLDPTIDQSTITIIAGTTTVTDEANDEVDVGTYPNELVKGQLADWMTNVVSKRVTVRAMCSFRKYHEAGHKTLNASVDQKMVTHRIVLTSAVTGTYSTLQQFDPGEPVPPLYPAAGSVAKDVYDSVSQLQYSGKTTWVADESRQDITLGTSLTLIGPNNTYEKLMIQSVTINPHSGKLTVEYGPSNPLDAADLVELARANRWRIVYNMPSGRATGQASGNNLSVELGADTPKENTQHALGNYALQAATAIDSTDVTKTNVVAKDATNKQIYIYQVNNSDGSKVNALGSIIMKLSQVLGRDVYFQETDICVNGEAMLAVVLRSDPYPKP